jgi:hypothetical protein
VGPLSATVKDLGLVDLATLLSLSATFTVAEDAIENWSEVEFDDAEINMIAELPTETRLHITARLVHLAELARESLRQLDGRVLQLQGVGS